VLAARCALNESAAQGDVRYFTSGAPEQFSRVAAQLLGTPIQAAPLR
jgi:hypothetical protein